MRACGVTSEPGKPVPASRVLQKMGLHSIACLTRHAIEYHVAV